MGRPMPADLRPLGTAGRTILADASRRAKPALAAHPQGWRGGSLPEQQVDVGNESLGPSPWRAKAHGDVDRANESDAEKGSAAV